MRTKKEVSGKRQKIFYQRWRAFLHTEQTEESGFFIILYNITLF